MIQQALNNYRITILDQALEVIRTYKQNKRDQNEAGGILLGQIKGSEIFILKASVPCKLDKASRYRFERDKEAAQIIIDYEFANSSGKTIYLGEWHTHPQDIPIPSPDDIIMITSQYKMNTKNEPFLLLLIQGIEAIYLGIYDGKKMHSSTISQQ